MRIRVRPDSGRVGSFTGQALPVVRIVVRPPSRSPNTPNPQPPSCELDLSRVAKQPAKQCQSTIHSKQGALWLPSLRGCECVVSFSRAVSLNLSRILSVRNLPLIYFVWSCIAGARRKRGLRRSCRERGRPSGRSNSVRLLLVPVHFPLDSSTCCCALKLTGDHLTYALPYQGGGFSFMAASALRASSWNVQTQVPVRLLRAADVERVRLLRSTLLCYLLGRRLRELK